MLRPRPATTTRLASQRRSFWWARYQTGQPAHDSNYQRHAVVKRLRTHQSKEHDALRRSRDWDRGSWRGRLASSWGGRRHGCRWEDSNEAPERSERGNETPFTDPRIERVARRMEEIGRQVEQDPFGALFGRRLASPGRPESWFPNNLFATWGWKAFTAREFGQSAREVQKSDRTAEPQAPQKSAGERGKTQKDDNKSAVHVNTKPNDTSSSTPISQKPPNRLMDEFEFDPITMRRVPRRPDLRESEDQAFDIPVKKFIAKQTQTEQHRGLVEGDHGVTEHKPSTEPTGKSNPEAQKTSGAHDGSAPGLQFTRPNDPVAKVLDREDVKEARLPDQTQQQRTQSWLAREGFGSPEPPHTAAASQADTRSHHGSDLGQQQKGERLAYDSSEPKQEDLDLLRTSDACAGSAISRKPAKMSEAAKRRQREMLDDEFKVAKQSTLADAEEVAAQRAVKARKVPGSRSSPTYTEAPVSMGADSYESPSTASRMERMENEIQDHENSYVAEMQAQETTRPSKRRFDEFGTQSLSHAAITSNAGRPAGPHFGRVCYPRTASSVMKGEGDVSPNIGRFAERSPLSSRKVLEQSAENTQRQQDGTLTREIRSIYEKEYGTIDASHRQPAISRTQETSGPSSSSIRRDGKGSTRGSEGKPRRDPTEHALRMEEREQILFEDIKEIDNEIYDIETELGDASNALPMATNLTGTPESSSSAQPSASNTYKILAYDPSTQDVTTATTTSSAFPSSQVKTEKTTSLPEVLHLLNNPARFLPYFASLEADGFEIVSGSSDVLVFKQTRDAKPAERASSSMDEPPFPAPTLSPINPIDGTTTGNFASPTGFVNHDAVLPSSLSDPAPEPSATVEPDQPVEPSPSPPKADSNPNPGPNPTLTASTASSKDKVRREEDVFSGRSRWAPSEEDVGTKTRTGGGKMKRTARRVFLVGVWCAACSYAVGVVLEFFRTGGSGGLGIQGF